MKILGIDPGTTTLGFGVIEFIDNKAIPLNYGVIETTPKLEQKYKLKEIFTDLQELIKVENPDLIAIEKLFFFKNPKTVINVGMAIGVCILTATLANKEILEITPLQVKNCMTGYGRANKKQIQEEVKKYLNLEEIPKPDDAADGLAIAITANILNNNF